MTFTAADLANIESAIATGELTVEVEGRRVTYRSIDDLIKARTTIQGALQASGGTSATPRVSLAIRSRA